MASQPTLFDPVRASDTEAGHCGVPGLVLYPDLISPTEEGETVAAVDQLPWLGDLRRRVQHYGYKYDYRARAIDRSMHLGGLPPFAVTLGRRLLDLGLVHKLPDQVIVNEYLPGQGISAHVDCEPCFNDCIVTVSLAATYEMDFIHCETGELRSTLLPQRSALVMSGPSRYDWMHQIKARKSDHGRPRQRRVSLTFRNVILSA